MFASIILWRFALRCSFDICRDTAKSASSMLIHVRLRLHSINSVLNVRFVDNASVRHAPAAAEEVARSVWFMPLGTEYPYDQALRDSW